MKSQQYVHSKNIVEITASTITDQSLYQVAMIDTNADLYLLTTGFNGFERVRKIGMNESIENSSTLLELQYNFFHHL